MRSFLFVLAFGFLVSAPRVFAYDSGTHAFLADSAIDFYNKTAAITFPADLKDYFIDGVLREDDIPRFFNHFYDPVFNRGLTYNPMINPVNIPGNWETSKAWAEDGKSQNAIVYKVAPAIASILSAAEKGRISEIAADSDFTWQRAIDWYRAGKKEEAMFALGHVIHLMEDASVPDHTRNDPHPGGSPYETWASKFTPQAPDAGVTQELKNKPMISLASLGAYFDGIATYSNNNFYSRNTIGLQSGYTMPVADMSDVDVRGGKYYVMGRDGEGNEYPLLKKSSVLSLLFDVKNITITIDDDAVLGSYWPLLSAKAVQYAAGVLDLFFKTALAAGDHVGDQSDKTHQRDVADRAKPIVFTDRSVVKVGEKIIESGEDFTPFGRVVLIFDLPNGKSVNVSLLADSEGAFNNVYQVPADAVLGNYTYSAKDLSTSAASGKVVYAVVAEIRKAAPAASATTTAPSTAGAQKATTTSSTSSQAAVAAKQCVFNASDTPPHTPVVLNEIAWMGGSETYNLNASDEWFELRNVSGASVNLSGWQAVNKRGTIKMLFPANTILSPWGFYLLERTDDDAVPNIPADRIYTGSLANSDEGLEIFDANCRSVDIAAADPDWPAGDTASRRTMERRDDLSWYTSGSFNGKIYGTPRAPNGPTYVPPSQNQNISYHSGGNNSANDAQDAPNQTSSPPAIVITEIMYNPPGADDGREWVEVVNEGASSVALGPLKFREGGSNHNLALPLGSESLPPGGYAVIANGTSTFFGDFPAFSGSLFHASFSLNNGGGEISLKYGDDIFATVAYASSSGAYGDGNSLQLVGGAWTWSRPTPGAPNVLDQSLVDSEESDSPPIAGVGADHVVIGELQAGGADAGDEFIELYNPGGSDVELGGWSLQYVGGGSSEISSSTVFKIDFSPGDSIKQKRFFLAARGKDGTGNDGYAGTRTPDLRYRSFALSGGAHGGAIMLVATTTGVSSLSDATIVDKAIYGESDLFAGFVSAPVPGDGESLERRAFRGGNCFSALPGSSGEFLGNGCDAGSSASEFEIRNTPFPQNFQSLPEPRMAPSAPAPFPGESVIARYHYDDMNIRFKWNASRDSTDSPSGMTYKISDIIATTSLEFVYPLPEIGKQYEFTITAFDRDGMPSDGVDVNVETPVAATEPVVFSQTALPSASVGSHYSDNWYQLGRGFSGTLHSLTLRGAIDNSQFGGSHIFLKEFEDEDYSHELNSFTLSDSAPFTSDVKNVKMQNLDIAFHPFSYYRLDTYQDYQNRSVILLGTADRGNAMHDSFIMDVGRVESRYEFSPFMVMEGIQGPAVDVSVPQKPTVPRIGEPNFDKFALSLGVSWSTSTDLDSLDSRITYEYNVTTLADFSESGWQNVGANTSVDIPLEFPNKYKIGVRASDDTGEKSDVSSIDWEFPGGFSPYLLTSSSNSVFQDWFAPASAVITAVEFRTTGFWTDSRNPFSNRCRVDLYDITDGAERMLAGSLSSLEGPSCGGNPIFDFNVASSAVLSGHTYRFRFYFDICAWAGACGVKFYGTNENTAGGLFSISQIKNAAMRINNGGVALFSNF